jgi:hypothetical protein
MFANIIRTDGYTVDFIFCRRKTKFPTTFELKLEHFTKEGVDKHYKPIYLDSGRKYVFTGVTGSDLLNNEVRRCSSKEYYTMTGSRRDQPKLEKEKIDSGMKKIETDIPTAKTASKAQYEKHIRYMLSNLLEIFKFYGPNKAEGRFRRFQGCKRAREEMLNIIINGGKKYNKGRRRHTKLNRRKRKKKRKKSISSTEEDAKK